MTREHLQTLAAEQMAAAFESTERNGVQGITFSATYKKTPALEVKTTYIFAKGAKITEDTDA